MGMSREIYLARREPYALEMAQVPLATVERWIPRLRDDRQRLVLERWLTGDSAEEIGQRLNVTRERIRQVLRRSLRAIGYAERGVLHPDALPRLFKEPS